MTMLWLLIFSPRLLHCQVGAADQDQAGELRRAAKQILSENDWLKQYVEIQNGAIVSLSTDSRCEIIAADVAGSQGARPDVLILNELTCITKKEFAENLLDNAAKVPAGVVVIATNAGFLGSWQHEWRELARTSPRWSSHFFREPAPWLSPEEIAEARRRNPVSRFNRLWQGQWVPGTGDALDPEDIEQCVVLPGPMPHRIVGFWNFGALDLGIKKDHSAVCVLASDPYTRRLRLADCKSWSPAQHGGQVDLGKVEDELLELYDRHQLHCLLYDPWQAQYLAQRLRGAGCRMIEFGYSPANLDQMAKRLMSLFRNREIELYRDNALVRDLCSMSLQEKANGTYKLVATRDPARGHCDRGFSFAMAAAKADDFVVSCRNWIRNGDELYDGGRLALAV